MKNTQLVPRQINLLCELVAHNRHGRLFEPFGAIPTQNQEYVIYLRGQDSLYLTQLSDLDALCAADYLDAHWNRLSNARLYSLSKGAIEAVKSGLIVGEQRVSKQTQTAVTPRQTADMLRSALKGHMAASMKGIALGEAIICLGNIQDAYYQSVPDTAVIMHRLDELGQQLMAHLQTAVTIPEKVAASHTIASFAEWACAIYSMLPALPEST